MKKFTTFACLAMATVFALNAFADLEGNDLPRVWGEADAARLASSSFNKAEADSFQLMGPQGSGTPYFGDFQGTPGKALDGMVDGWTSEDQTAPTAASHWNISDYQQEGGDFGAWCGSLDYPSCDGLVLDPDGGYGNNWNDLIMFRKSVPSVVTSTTVNITGSVQIWTEDGWDFVYLSQKVNGQAGFIDLETWTGFDIVEQGGPWNIDYSATWNPGDYINTDEVVLFFRFQSDTAWSDEDCDNLLAYTAGAVQVDDLSVSVVNDGTPIAGSPFFEDFEGGGTLGDPSAEPPIPSDFEWGITYPDGVGDFAKLWEGLDDEDDCRANFTKQVAFIDDGVVVPGTGGTECVMEFCYGPGGFVTNYTGGLAGPNEALANYALTPVMDWPDPTHDGLIHRMNVYRHNLISGNGTGVLYNFGLRSAKAGDAIEDASWQSGGNWYSDNGLYTQQGTNWTNVLEQGRDRVQMRFGAVDFGALIPVFGTHSTPAPYYDHIRIKTFPVTGPSIAWAENDLAQDNFPAIGDIDVVDLSRNSVRFDQGFNISANAHLRLDPGDSLNLDVIPARTGAELQGMPKMHWAMQKNPFFDAFRIPDPPNPIDGWAANTQGTFAFDLPDTGFLFPGDQLHYYIEASDGGGVGSLPIQTNYAPNNRDGFGDFSKPLAYNTAFQIHCMPTVTGVNTSDPDDPRPIHPQLLFWNDFFNRGGEEEWFGALGALGLELGVDYDAYWTNRPDNGAGNGLGGRTELPAIEDYDDMLYTSGDLAAYTITAVDFETDAGDDVGLLDSWLGVGGKDLFLSGDNLVFDMATTGVPETLDFVTNRIGVTHRALSILSFIDDQTAALVKPYAFDADEQPVFFLSRQTAGLRTAAVWPSISSTA